jgi:glycosyltransferase involved in cell wall biosynthesis
MENPPQLTLIIPCFNEEIGIAESIAAISHYMQQNIPDVSYELLMVNDGSEDGTLAVLHRLRAKHTELQVVSYERNRGRGYALKRGFSASRGAYVISLDADLSYDVSHIGEMLQVFKDKPKTDAVIVSAYHKQGVVKNIPFRRLLLSRVANAILKSFFSGKISTVTCVVRAYRGDVIRSICLLETGKEIHLEILRKLNLQGVNIQEIPGRLIWKKQKGATKRRKNELNVNSSARRHLEYALMTRPTLVFKVAAIILLIIGVYESGIVFLKTYQFFDIAQGDGLVNSLWYALRSAYHYSPHTFFIAFACLILGLQALSLLVMLKTTKLQQEEVIQHLLAVLDKRKLD